MVEVGLMTMKLGNKKEEESTEILKKKKNIDEGARAAEGTSEKYALSRKL